MRISDWSSDVCSSDLADPPAGADGAPASPQKEDDNETDGWQCAKDVAWGAVEDTVVGTVIGVFCSAAAEPAMKYSGGNSRSSEERRVGQVCVSTCRSRWSRLY